MTAPYQAGARGPAEQLVPLLESLLQRARLLPFMSPIVPKTFLAGPRLIAQVSSGRRDTGEVIVGIGAHHPSALQPLGRFDIEWWAIRQATPTAGSRHQTFWTARFVRHLSDLLLGGRHGAVPLAEHAGWCPQSGAPGGSATLQTYGAGDQYGRRFIRLAADDEPLAPAWRPIAPARALFRDFENDNRPWPEDPSLLCWWLPSFWGAYEEPAF